MSDLISRQAAIDAAAVPPEWDGMYIQDLNGRIREAIEQLPSAQPEIIHCKDCRHLLLTGGNETTGEGIYTCDVWKRRTFKGTAFCSYAERKSE